MLKELERLIELQHTVGSFQLPMKVVDAMELVKNTSVLTETEQYQKVIFWMSWLEHHIEKLQVECDKLARSVPEPAARPVPEPEALPEVAAEVKANE